jgi:hypothetical protein
MTSFYSSSTKFGIIASVALATLLIPPPSWSDGEGTEEHPVQSIDGLANSARPVGGVSALKSEYLLENGNVEEAVAYARKELHSNPDDIEAHLIYARALERKLRLQNEKDPQLFADCVREWLNVMRNESGEEKGISVHGISPLGHLFEDEDHGILAKQHLTALCGAPPRPWETDAKYMKKVLKNVSVRGKIIQPTTSGTHY